MNKRLTIAAVASALVLALAGCGAASTGSAPLAQPPVVTASSTAVPPPAPTTLPPTEDATAHASKIKGQVSSAVKVVTITESNDPNNQIGRPGGYTSAAVIYDKSVECVGKDIRVDCGAKVEVFDSPADAKARAGYIQGLTKSMPIIGKEYDYLRGVALLRVAGDVKPSVAKKYDTAFGGVLFK